MEALTPESRRALGVLVAQYRAALDAGADPAAGVEVAALDIPVICARSGDHQIGHEHLSQLAAAKLAECVPVLGEARWRYLPPPVAREQFADGDPLSMARTAITLDRPDVAQALALIAIAERMPI